MNFFQKSTCSALFILGCISQSFSQVHDPKWRELVHRKDKEWFASEEAKAVAENVLLYQRNAGGWPKNIQMQKPLSNEEKKVLIAQKPISSDCTTDNGATIQEMKFLSKVYEKNPDPRYREAFQKGLQFILDLQYENGGWPQFHPSHGGYSKHITYNDDSMVNIMELLKTLADGSKEFSINPDTALITRARKAFGKGVECILKTQYKQKDVLTGWCAQHDEVTLLPAKARAYELPSLSGAESAAIVLLLMTLENPSPEIKNAVSSAVSWFEKTKITGWRQERYFTEAGIKEKRLVSDSTAKPLWARFMELEDNTPFFCDRDGVKKATMYEIGQERRNGYVWYSDKPLKVLEKYPAWKARWVK